MTLICTKCESGARIEKEGNDLHCRTCGNVVIDGVKARWPIVEKEVFMSMKKKCRKCNEKNALVEGLCYACYKKEHGHAYVPETHRGDQKRETVEAKKAAPAPENTTTFAPQNWPDRARDQIKAGPATQPDKDRKEKAIEKLLKPETIVISFTDYPELYEALSANAKKEFRSPAGQIMYMIQKIFDAGKEAA